MLSRESSCPVRDLLNVDYITQTKKVVSASASNSHLIRRIAITTMASRTFASVRAALASTLHGFIEILTLSSFTRPFFGRLRARPPALPSDLSRPPAAPSSLNSCVFSPTKPAPPSTKPSPPLPLCSS